MNLSSLPQVVKRSSKRIGRGYGSGKGGHTSTRGTKGQKARGSVRVLFEGTKAKKSLLKRLPFLRGKGKFKSWNEKPYIVKLNNLSEWPEKVVVNVENLMKAGLVKEGATLVKLVGNFKIKQALSVKVNVSNGAKKCIEAAGGKIEE
jgi:large subunit ribosomal protein L15